MMRACGTALAVVMVLGLAACSERDQSSPSAASKADGQPWQGAKNNFGSPGYQPGEKLRWESHLRQRAQHQNEYVKTN